MSKIPNNLRSVIRIENFPSRIELFELLDKYLSQNNIVKDYTTDNKDNIISFQFKNSVKFI
jgi:hypothetical protein